MTWARIINHPTRRGDPSPRINDESEQLKFVVVMMMMMEQKIGEFAHLHTGLLELLCSGQRPELDC